MATVEMTLADCWCGLPFSMPMWLYEACERNGTTFHCPLGYKIVFKETSADRLCRERGRLKQRLAQKDDAIAREQRWRQEAERLASAYKGQVTKLRKRAMAGVCPCCSRSFQNLKRHMENKHPGFVDGPDLEIVEGRKT